MNLSRNEQCFIFEKFDDCSKQVDKIVESEKQQKDLMVKSKKISFQLNNFSKILHEFGFRRPVRSLVKINS